MEVHTFKILTNFIATETGKSENGSLLRWQDIHHKASKMDSNDICAALLGA